ncbi:hypothetical protein AAG570_010516 [Ranatra chinensis]|uniref:Phospholipase A2 n=1 Tax=Ranatra chinensis TaxID=642074 RepID=A0ABD0YMT2_9HEMI
MMDLMERCDQLSAPSNFKSNESGRSEEGRGSGSIFNGVLPGTKWCGAGDVAETYFDLGEEEIIDRCCRIHDLCPAKVRAYTTRYNLTNNSIYTKSHCQCDNIFHTCLKSTNHSTADVMGNIYFNILRVPCVEERNGGRRFKLPDPY